MEKTKIASSSGCASLSDKTVSLVTTSTKKEIGANSSKKLTLDAMQSDGVKSFMLNQPPKGKDNPNAKLHNQLKGAIIAAFDADVQAVMAKETKTLSDMEKGVKDYWKKQVGSIFAYYRRELKKREEKAATGPTDRATPKEMLVKTLQDALGRAKDIEGPDFDVVKVTKLIVDTIALIG